MTVSKTLMRHHKQSIRQKAGIMQSGDRQDNLPARAEMIERGRRLLSDPDWPDLAVCRQLAGNLMPLLQEN